MTSRSVLFGRHQPGGIFTVEDLVDHPGNVWFVDSGASGATDGDGYGRSPDTPFATLDYAVGKCTANNGDVIYVMPGHAETIVADSGVDIDVAGVKVIGLGWGADRPTFTFQTAVTADMKLAANSVQIHNLLLLGNIDATTGVIEVSGTDCQIINCEYRDATGQATDVITTLNNADRLLIDGFTYIGDPAAGTNTAIFLNGSDDSEIKNCNIYGNFAIGAIECRTTACNRLNVHDCRIWTENAADIAIVDTITASTGWMGPNLYLMLQDNAANITTAVTGATFQMMPPVYVCNLVNEQAMLSTWTATTNA